MVDSLTYSQLAGRYRFACMQERGWTNLTLAPDGGVSGNVPPEQEDKYADDEAACSEATGAQYPVPPMTERAIRERYGYEVQTRECLVAAGYQISEPPSEDAWVAAFLSSADGLWLPYYEVYTQQPVGQAEESSLRERCPDPADRFYAP